MSKFEASVATPARSGVFEQATDRRVEQFSESISLDRRLYAHDIRASLAHARMLQAVGILVPEELSLLETALGEIQGEIEADCFPWRTELEDIHMHIEQALIERLGDTGRKIHTGRSRNDQVSTALRLWTRDALDGVDRQLAELQRAFVRRCDADEGLVLPGYTHLQRAQPVLAAHYWLAYCEKLERDRERLADCRRRLNLSSLGTAALAGTSLPIDRRRVAHDLGFDGLAANSLDASGDRDFVLEAAFALALIGEHLSGWAEEWILWSTVEFQFLKLPHAFCTGSSIMPQKVNPDVLELIRGRTARLVGNVQALLVLVKSLPLAYNRDLQEDKRPLFDSVDTITGCLEMATAVVAGAELDRHSIAARLDSGYLDATTLMEHLIELDVPLRTAHHLVGKLVGEARRRGVRLADLPVEVFQEAHPQLDSGVYNSLGVERAVRAFRSEGSTGPPQVAAQVLLWKGRLGLEPAVEGGTDGNNN